MAKQFTNAPKRPPLQGAKFGIPSPILESYATTNESTMGQVVSFTETEADKLDRCEVYFRGKIVRATCCHPGIKDGMNVNMIEQPRGIWWATVMQKSWYSRPLIELAAKGHNYQAAVEYLLSFGAKWRPKLIIIDKRGQPSGINPYDDPRGFEFYDTNGDGFIDRNEWPYGDLAGGFDSWDLNGDGLINRIEFDGKGEYLNNSEPTREDAGIVYPPDFPVDMIPDPINMWDGSCGETIYWDSVAGAYYKLVRFAHMQEVSFARLIQSTRIMNGIPIAGYDPAWAYIPNQPGPVFYSVVKIYFPLTGGTMEIRFVDKVIPVWSPPVSGFPGFWFLEYGYSFSLFFDI